MSDEKPEEKPYRCKQCGFSTDSLEDLVEHKVDEFYGKGHRTAKEFLDCEYCHPKFERELLKRGWKRPEEQKPSPEDVLPHKHLVDVEVPKRDYTKLYIS